MRRGIRGKWKRPHHNSESGGRPPPGLTGRDIGLFYRNKQMKKERNAACEIKLEVPETVVSALHANIKSIEDIAQKENIYIESIKSLKFVKPNTDGADFIALKAAKSEKQSIYVTNIFPRDNDVIFVSQDEVNDVKNKSIENKPSCSQSRQHNYFMVISDDSSDAVSLCPHSDIILDELKIETKNKSMSTSNSTADGHVTLDISIDKKPVQTMMNSKDEPEEVIDSSADKELIYNIELDTKSIKSDIDIETKPVVARGSKADGAILLNVDMDVKPIKSGINTDIKPDLATDSKAKPIKLEKKTKNKTALSNSTRADEVIILDDNDSDVELVKIDTDIRAKFSASSEYEQGTSKVSHSETEKSDYKYGYDDIITGTFEEKLIESLSKGISVNMITDTTKKLSAALLDEYNIMVEETPKYKEMKKFRQTLPTYQKSKDVLNVVNNNQVVVISGETGCGKSTQVPQIILDDAIRNKKGANVKILVTQPRRIAASSLAMRVAEERAESMGKSVGYSVRLERVECRPRASIMFCTTGVLLVELEVNQSLSNYSHIILDEVHERDCQIDISMCMLRQVLKKRKDLKLILMSATIDAETLCAYYDNCPMLHIEGLAFPVQDVYLEQILHMTHYQLPPLDTKVPSKRPEKPWMKYVKGMKCTAALDMEKDIQYKAEIGPWLESIKRSIDRDVYQTLQDRRIELIDVQLIFQLLLCISRSDPGAILVFLPGIAEITKLIKIMRDSRQFPESHFDIHPLHSKLPTLTQHKIFSRPSGNIRKIIIATNIAETSITIDDIVYVVDCAKIKYNGLNVDDHVSTLQTEWASQANLRQRRGRAGRCQPGICYHLVSTFRANKLAERLLPELQRNDLLEPVLQIKRLRLGFADSALKMMPAVPDEKTIRNAVRHLQQCGALDESETLTPLGWHLARLPVHPAAGKLLLLGALFGCLERAASVAAVWGFKDPFQLVIGKQMELETAKKTLALGEPSDHIAMSEALMQWERCESYSQKSSFARDYFLSMSTLKLLSDMKKQFGQNLKQMGFLHSGDVRSIWENRNVDNLALFKAIVAASLYPNIATVRWKNMHINARNPRKLPSIEVKTPEDPRVLVHPSSVMHTKHEQQYQRNCRPLPLCSDPGANWLVYWLKQRSSELYLIDVTLVYTLPLLFFGELNLTQADDSEECLIDIKTIKVCCDKETTQLLFQLRSLLDQVIASKIMVSHGQKRSSIFEEHVLNAVIRLITAEDARTQYLDDNDQFYSDDYDGRTRY